MTRFALVLWLLLVGSLQIARTQESIPAPSILQNPSAGENLTRFFSSKTPYEFWLTCLIAVLGLTIIGALIFAIKRMNAIRPEDVTRPVIVLTVITGTLILVTVGYSNEQIAPAFGLFGTIVGYMLGRLDRSSPSAEAPSPPPRSEGSTQETGGTAPDVTRNASR